MTINKLIKYYYLLMKKNNESQRIKNPSFMINYTPFRTKKISYSKKNPIKLKFNKISNQM